MIVGRHRDAQKWAPVLKRIYDQMPEPKWVIAMGACASVWRARSTPTPRCRGVDKIVPVDVYISGCPPRPEKPVLRPC